MNGLEKIIMKFRALPLLLLGFLSLRLFAQEATEEAPQGWPIVERCVGEPLVPPADWSFEGTILATGWAGIHGIHAEWDTPRILIFENGWYPFEAGLSPNGEWYAAIQHQINLYAVPALRVSSYGLRIYSTKDRNISYFYDISGGTQEVFWLDNERVVYIALGTHLLYPFTGESTGYSGTVDLQLLVAPDASWASHSSYSLTSWYFEELENYQTLYEATNGYATAFSPNSQFIAFHKQIENSDSEKVFIGSVVFLNQNGELLDTVYVAEESFGSQSVFIWDTNAWSKDGRYYSFAIRTNNDSFSGILYLADLQDRVIINTCLEVYSNGLEWSPSENKLIATSTNFEQYPLQIVNLDLWQAYYLPQFHQGKLIGWRAD
jgi:hypothetical protein